MLQIIGKTAQARRNIADQDRMKRQDEANRRQTEQAKQNYGKTTISKIDKNHINDGEYTDYEEVE